MVPQLEFAQDIEPAQKSDPELALWNQLAYGADLTWRLRDAVLYKVTPAGEWLVIPTALYYELLPLHHDKISCIRVFRAHHHLA